MRKKRLAKGNKHFKVESTLKLRSVRDKEIEDELDFITERRPEPQKLTAAELQERLEDEEPLLQERDPEELQEEVIQEFVPT